MGDEPLTLVLSGVEATEALGHAVGAQLVAGDLIALEGDLGAGKTAFARGLGRGLGVHHGVSSPTFTLMQEHRGRLPFFHFDAWMAGREAAFLEGGGADYLAGEGVAAVEWADRVRAHLPRPHLLVRLAHRTQDSRTAVLSVVRADPPSDRERRLDAVLEGLRAPGDELAEAGVAGDSGEPPPGPPVVGEA